MLVKERLTRNYIVRCLYYLLNDYLSKIRYQKGNIKTTSGTIHATKDVKESITYIYEVFNDYKYYAGLDSFYGKIAEVGPGDNSGVAMLFIQDGCEAVDLADRFYSARNIDRQVDVYNQLLSQCSTAKAKLSGCDFTDEKTFTCISRYYGDSASAEQFFCETNSYD